MTYSLKVKYGDEEIGMLTQNQDSGLLKLVYNESWQQNGFAISPALPLNNNHSQASAYNYLDNSLPEGEARKLLALNLGISEKNLYLQVKVLGKDLSGAISFSDKTAKENEAAEFRLITEGELSERLDNKEEFGLLFWDEKPRLSVSGVQDKLNVFINHQGQIGFGDGSLCSTHILKFEKRNCQHLVLNEFFCMQLSKSVGLPTANVAFKRFGAHPALLVTRFDRKFDASSLKVMRRHVIDGCQALNLPRDYKYERNLGDGRDMKHVRDGASLEKLFSFCRKTSSPVENMQQLINWQLFNLMINNYDSHGKNLCFYYHKDKSLCTPAYDLVNVSMFDQFKHVLAMAMGEEFDPEVIHAYQLADFAQTCALDKKLVSRMLKSLGKKVFEQLNNKAIISELQKAQCINKKELEYLNVLAKNIESRTRYLLKQTDEMLTIYV